MADAVYQLLESALKSGSCILGQVRITIEGKGFTLRHREDGGRSDLRVYEDAPAAIEIARFDERKKFRSLKTAPNLARGWCLKLRDMEEVRRALGFFYPGRLEALAALGDKRLAATALRETLERQSGMYRVTAKISDHEIDSVVAGVCRSDGGCLRTILWAKNQAGEPASALLPAEKFTLHADQSAHAGMTDPGQALPLICQEACAILVDACRKKVLKGRGSAEPNE